MTSRLVAFLEGSGNDSKGRRLADVLQFDDDSIDYTHDFIRWMFPLREASGSNFTAPTLFASEIETIRISSGLPRVRFMSRTGLVSFIDRPARIGW